MNAAARALAQGYPIAGTEGRLWTFSRQMLGAMLLFAMVLASALSVVYVKALDRQLFSQLQTLSQERDQLHLQWGQLLLEQNTWSAPARVQAIAQQQLGMVVPSPKEITVVNLVNR